MQRTVVALIAVSVVLAGVSVGPALAAQDDTADRTLNSCGTITEPGVYTLGADVQNGSAGACIQVEADDVVLDGAGHTVAGDGDGTGVAVNATTERAQDSYTNVTVRNLRVTSLTNGVAFVNTENTTVANLTATDLGTGVRAGTTVDSGPGFPQRADRATVRDSTFVDVDRGVDVEMSVAPTVAGNDVRNFSTFGFRLASTERATVVDNDVERPGLGNDLSNEAAIELSNDVGPTPPDGPYTTVAANDLDGGDLVLAGDDGHFPDTRIVDNEVEDGDIGFYGGVRPGETENTSIAGNEVIDGAISLTFTRNVTVVDNRVVNGSPTDRLERGIIVNDAPQVTVAGNAVTGAGTGVSVEAGTSNATVTDNRVTDADTGVRLRGFGTANLVANNRIAADEAGVEVDSGATGPADRVRDNIVTGAADGVRVVATVHPIHVVGNDLSDTEDAVHVYEPTECVAGAEGAELVSVHENDLAASVYGVHNDDPDVLNATGNDWGAADGPSSAADPDAPFADPVTGDLADGSGSAVSERPGDPGVSNVHFAASDDGNETAA
jgi:nitrous oxidase accessory protein NosD